MSQSTEQGSTDTISIQHARKALTSNVEYSQENGSVDVNGGIDDDDQLDMMARDAKAMNTTTPNDTSPQGPFGISEEQC